MNIIHYSLGFLPYRSGGLVKYCTDLMLTQIEEGYTVGLLWPGEILPWSGQKIRKHKDYFGVKNYEIINPLPVPLDEGVCNPLLYMQKGKEEIYEHFFRYVQPDVLHIHTLMGLHQELLSAARKSGVRIVFTAHDYYGICPKVTLFCAGHTCDKNYDCVDCVACNRTGLSMTKISIMQSAAYRTIKNSPAIKAVRKKHRKQFFDESIRETENSKALPLQVESYRKLRDFYLNMLSKMDVIHFNSSVTRDTYLRYFNPTNYEVIPITHRNIKDNRKIKKFDHEKLRITYLGPAKPFKGYNLLKNVLDELWEKGVKNFTLQIYNVVPDTSPYLIMHDGYEYGELGSIFDKTDVLVAPSIWYETFGFTVLEALSYGVPVIVSDNVGAKDILPQEMPIVSANNPQELSGAINDMFDRGRLEKLNRLICEQVALPLMMDVITVYKENTK